MPRSLRTTPTTRRSLPISSAAEPAYAGAALRHPRPAFVSGRVALLGAVAIYVGAVALWPLVRLFVEAFASGEGRPFDVLIEQWRSPSTLRALGHTLEASVLATLLS